MTKLKRMMSVLLVLIMVISLVACKSEDEKTTPEANEGNDTAEVTESNDDNVEAPVSETAERVDLVFYLMGEAPEGEGAVEEAINALLLDKVNATVDFQFSTWTDWSQKYNLELTSGSSDLIYVANWNNYGTLAKSGAFLELEDYLETYMPNINATIDPNVLNVCRVDGSLYAIPNTWNEYTSEGIQYREDLRELYNLPVPDSIENFEAYLAGIKEADPTQPLLAMSTSESNGLQTAFNAAHIFNMKYPWITKEGLPYGLATDYNSPSAVYDYWYSDDFIEDMKLMKKWADLGFWSRSALSDPNNGDAFRNGLCVAEVAGMNANKVAITSNAFATENPEWKTEFYAYGQTTGVIYPNSPTGNGTAIVRSSKNPERAAMVLDLFLTDQELNALVNYGILGTHYEIDADGNYKNLSEDFGYESFNAWNLRNGEYKLPQVSDVLTNKYFAIFEDIASKTNYPNINIYADFTEDYSAYEVERSAVSDVMRQYLAPIQAGFVEDVDAAIAEFLQKAEEAGLSTCREAYEAQWEAYCEEFGYN